MKILEVNVLVYSEDMELLWKYRNIIKMQQGFLRSTKEGEAFCEGQRREEIKKILSSHLDSLCKSEL